MARVPQRPLGSQGLVCSAQGLGCMGMTMACDKVDHIAQEEESLRTISKALELDINMLDTAWVYQSPGPGGDRIFYNEELVGKAIKQHGRDKFVIATKFGVVFKDGKMVVSGTEETIRSQLADSLKRLGTDYIDLYYMHRMDPTTPIEETVAVLKSLVEEGKIKYIGLSECTPDELCRAHATRDLEEAVVPTARELGVAIVAYSPLSRGFLTDINAFDKLEDNDRRRTLPRFKQEKLAESKAKVARFFELAKEKNVTPAQLALGWVHAQGNDVFPIPGTKSSTRIVENADAAFVSLSPEEWNEVAAAINADRHFPTSAAANFNTRMNV
ncbi:hypothetical protein AC1031_003556 [Aphanomyces cochlioides]|nr:hypothetical protein AC1031_003556 [Aphanomyces cochlioides]